jgi:PAS domain S-box-containing protein
MSDLIKPENDRFEHNINPVESDKIVTSLESVCRSVKESLKKGEEQFRIATENIFDWEYWLGADDKYLFISPFCEQITGYSPEEFQNNPGLLLDIAHPEDRTLLESHLKEEKSGNDIFPVKFRIVTRNGEERIISHVCRRVKSSTGDPLGVRAVNYDITEQVKADRQRKELEECIRQASQKVENLGTLATGMANDFNNMIQAIIGHVELVVGELAPFTSATLPSEDPSPPILNKQLPDLDDKDKQSAQKLDINNLIKKTMRALESTISEHIELRFLPGPDVPIIEAEKQQIRQLILSLVTNASRMIGTEKGWIIMITGSMECDQQYLESTYLNHEMKKGPYAFLKVIINGPGMDALDLQNMFDKSHSENDSKIDLGLSGVLGIINTHNGAIKIENETDVGTSFKFLFPVPQEQPAEEKDQSSDVSELDLGSKGTVLLVDDEEFVLSMAKSMLELVKFHVITAHDGEQAVDLFQEHEDEITCILLDMNMPGKSGKETLAQLRQINAKTPITISSGHTQDEINEELDGAQPDMFLQKPYHFSTLVAKLNDVLS